MIFHCAPKIVYVFHLLKKKKNSACASWEKGMHQASSQYKNMHHKIMARRVLF